MIVMSRDEAISYLSEYRQNMRIYNHSHQVCLKKALDIAIESTRTLETIEKDIKDQMDFVISCGNSDTDLGMAIDIVNQHIKG